MIKNIVSRQNEKIVYNIPHMFKSNAIKLTYVLFVSLLLGLEIANKTNNQIGIKVANLNIINLNIR